jgi:peptidoglycan/LPS O-acetylase OafA/YrhL
VLVAVGAVVAAIGVDSYSVYLWHMGVQRWILPWYGRAFLAPIADPTLRYAAGLAAYVATAVLLGLGLARLIERPALALRERLAPSRSGRGVIDPGPAPAHATRPAAAIFVDTPAPPGRDSAPSR